MSKYIDKEVLLERMNRTRPYEGENGSFERHRRLQWLADMEQVNMCPAADVEEVRHGRWDGDSCSVCWFSWCDVTYDVPQMQMPYCPNCGSRMDLEGDAE